MKVLGKMNPLIAALLVAAVVAALLVVFWPGADKKYVTADRSRARCPSTRAPR